MLKRNGLILSLLLALTLGIVGCNETSAPSPPDEEDSPSTVPGPSPT